MGKWTVSLSSLDWVTRIVDTSFWTIGAVTQPATWNVLSCILKIINSTRSADCITTIVGFGQLCRHHIFLNHPNGNAVRDMKWCIFDFAKPWMMQEGIVLLPSVYSRVLFWGAGLISPNLEGRTWFSTKFGGSPDFRQIWGGRCRIYTGVNHALVG